MKNKPLLTLLLLFIAEILTAQRISEKVDDLLQFRYDEGSFSGNVLISKNDKIIFSESYGFANLEWNIANDSTSVFRLGSLSKQFTAAAILLLEQSDKLSVNDYLSDYIIDFPRGEHITIYQLITHTSGIKNLTDGTISMDNKKPLTLDQTINLFKDLPLDFEPGTDYKYSNSGYVVLARVIEHASGFSYDEYLEQSLFQPLEMNSTQSDNMREIIPNRAYGYSLGNKKLTNAEYIDMTIPKGGGSLISSITDLNKWNNELTHPKYLSNTLVGKVFAPNEWNYVYGWAIREIENEKVYIHNGGINGFSTNIIRFASQNIHIIVLSNFDFIKAGQLSREIARIVLTNQ